MLTYPSPVTDPPVKQQRYFLKCRVRSFTSMPCAIRSARSVRSCVFKWNRVLTPSTAIGPSGHTLSCSCTQEAPGAQHTRRGTMCCTYNVLHLIWPVAARGGGWWRGLLHVICWCWPQTGAVSG